MFDDILNISIQGSRESIPALDTEQLLYLLVEIKPPGDIEAQFLPVNLCLVIDRSTSMNGERLESIKLAVSKIIEKLDPEDVISVVSFSDRAEIILPTSRAQDTATLIAQINTMTAGGGTEIYQGLLTGFMEIRKVPIKKYTNHLILLTDGHTYGDTGECLQLSRQAAIEGIEISAFGIGSKWNDQFLDELVGLSGGKSAYIESPNSVISQLQQRIHGLGSVYAQNVRLLNSFPPAVKLRTVFKVVPFAQPLTFEENDVRLGSVEGDKPLVILLEFDVAPLNPDSKLELPIKIQADLPSVQVMDLGIKQTFDIDVQEQAPTIDPPRVLVEAVRALNFYKMNEKIWHDIESGQFGGATARMRRLTKRLLESGHTQLAQQAYSEAERLMTAGSISHEGRKKLKYGTRSLMTGTLGNEDGHL